MTNKQSIFNPGFGTLYSNIGDVDGYGGILATGELSLDSSFTHGLTSITRVGTGLYEFVLDTTYKKIFNPQFSLETSSAIALFPQVAYNSANKVTLRIVNGSGTATAPTVKCWLTWHFRVQV
jgi:hypothetical protein